eukprot:Nitzschia sp. Nitz4//scaffold6_size259037//131929//132066//NITZ4_001078-RA/size259037-exonerate_protein2genome-gene-0.191-mRNA-1//-1//CDS//3329556905//9107//frame0
MPTMQYSNLLSRLLPQSQTSARLLWETKPWRVSAAQPNDRWYSTQ